MEKAKVITEPHKPWKYIDYIHYQIDLTRWWNKKQWATSITFFTEPTQSNRATSRTVAITCSDMIAATWWHRRLGCRCLSWRRGWGISRRRSRGISWCRSRCISWSWSHFSIACLYSVSTQTLVADLQWGMGKES